MAAWMVARSDGAQYGNLMAFQFPKQKLIFGPSQIVNRINQDQDISPQFTLWNQQGSEVIQGTLLVIPIEGGLLYIRPMYLRASGGRIPELKQVVVAYQNQIVMKRRSTSLSIACLGAERRRHLLSNHPRWSQTPRRAPHRPRAPPPSASRRDRWHSRRNSTTHERSRRSVTETGRGMARRSSSLESCSADYRQKSSQ